MLRGIFIALALFTCASSTAQRPTNAISTRTCASVPQVSGEIDQVVTKMTSWLGCFREMSTDVGWIGLRFDRGVVAQSTGTTKVVLLSYSVGGDLWSVVHPLGPVEGDGEMVQFFVGKGLAGGTEAPGGVAIYEADFVGGRFTFPGRVSLMYSNEAGTAWLDLPGIELIHTAHQIDLGAIVDAEDVWILETQWKPRARQRILSHAACSWKRNRPLTLQHQGEEAFGVFLLAGLALADSDPSFRCEIDDIVGESRSLLERIDNALLASKQLADKLPGTSMRDLPGCAREGEYDTVMWALVRALKQYGHLLKENTRGHVLNGLLGKYDGRYVGDAAYTSEGFCGMQVPETENHILLLESSRYLINDLKKLVPGNAPLPYYDNSINGQRQWMLEMLNRLATGGFYEYNAIPYQRYTYYALANLADLSTDGDPVKTAAALLIRYLDSKFALSTLDLRRNAPFRRKVDLAYAESQSFFLHQDDPQTARWAYFAGSSIGLDNATWPEHTYAQGAADFRVMHWWHAGSAVIASITAQQPPEFLTSIVWDRAPSPYFQAFTSGGGPKNNFFAMEKSGYEIYWRDTSFLIAAGGEPVSPGYDYASFPPTGGTGIDIAAALIGYFTRGPLGAAAAVLGTDKLKEEFSVEAARKANTGLARPTLLIPARSATHRRDMLHFLGAPLQRNSCVAPNFMCGTNIEVPNIFTTVESCARMRLDDKILDAYWRNNLNDLGCPFFGKGESSNGSDHWASFANGAAAVRYNSRNQLAYFLTAKVQYIDGKAYIDLTFDGPGRDFHVLRYRDPGAEKDTQIDLGRRRGYQATKINHQIKEVNPGKYSIYMEGCYFGTLESSCPDSWIGVLNIEVRRGPEQERAPLICEASMPESQPTRGNVAVITFGTKAQGGSCLGAMVAGVFASPCHVRGTPPDSQQCGEAGGNYGFAEVISTGGRQEETDVFAADFSARVASKLFGFTDIPQTLKMRDGSSVSFLFHTFEAMTWAITAVTSAKPGAGPSTTLSRDIKSWPRAVGTNMNYLGGVYNIKDPKTGMFWSLDASNPSAPRILP